MSIQMRVVHTTRFAYDGKAVASYNQARLTPLTTPEQIVVHSRLEVSPKPWVYEYRDYFGTQVIAFEVVDPHETMTVTSTSTVQVDRRPAREPNATWEETSAREVSDRWTEYLMRPEIVAPTEDFAQRAKQMAADHALPGQAALALCELVRDEIEYVAGTTVAGTTAAHSWQQRAGVCQDMVHLVLGGLRVMGIPARYVSGYFHPAERPVVGEHVDASSHAWVEWWDEGWQPYDLTRGEHPDDRYVVLAAGRDYNDVKPLSGIYSGAETSEMDVTVEITRLA